MRDLTNKYKQSGYSFMRGWKRRMLRDLKKLTED